MSNELQKDDVVDIPDDKEFIREFEEAKTIQEVSDILDRRIFSHLKVQNWIHKNFPQSLPPSNSNSDV